jgi:hypothetical protein
MANLINILLNALRATWHFIENVSDEDPNRTDKFFELRAQAREAFPATDCNFVGDKSDSLLDSPCDETPPAGPADLDEIIEVTNNLIDAAKLVVSRWESGNLAEAVQNLQMVASFAEFTLENVAVEVKQEDVTSDLLEACIQARAALPDAWFAVECGVPTEVINLLNKAIAKAEASGTEHTKTPKKTTSWNVDLHASDAFFSTEDWMSDVANRCTYLGYQAWVEHNLESLLHSTDLTGVDAIEIAGCTEADGVVDVIDERDAEFYSVYTHTPNQGVECICDFNTKGQAVEFADALAARTSIPVYGNLCSLGVQNV